MTRRGHSFAVIGPGRVGSSLAMALVTNGWICKSIVYKTAEKNQIRKFKSSFPNAVVAAHPSLMSDDFQVLFVTVQDNEILNVVDCLSSLRNIDWKTKIVMHVSGVRSVGVLSSLQRHGAATGALHPISAFASRFDSAAAAGICYDFIGDRRSLRVAREITRLLLSKLIILKNDKQRLLLHIASAIASNSTVIAVRSAEKLVSSFVNLHELKSLMHGLLAATIKNLAVNDGMKSLTGPLARGDFEVINEHIKALENDAQLSQFYRSWSLLGVELLLHDKEFGSRMSRDGRSSLKKIRKLLENE